MRVDSLEWILAESTFRNYSFRAGNATAISGATGRGWARRTLRGWQASMTHRGVIPAARHMAGPVGCFQGLGIVRFTGINRFACKMYCNL